jgi:DNA-binding transcriptional LysR family regulator
MPVARTASIDLNRVAMFVKVVETGSFTAAASELRLPKSSVSRGVAALEEALATRLLQRSTRRLHLTDAGRRYFQQARQALAGLDEAATELSDLVHEPRGTVRITALDFGESRLARIIADFTRRYPRIHVDLTMTGRRVNLVEEGFDLAIRAGVLEDSTLVARRVARSELGLYASPAHVARSGKPRRLADLAGHECVLYRTAAGLLPWRLTGPRGPESVRVSGSVTTDDLAFVHRLVLADAGVGLLPDIMADDAVARGALLRLLPAHAVRGGAIFVVSPPLRHVPARVALLRDHLIAELPLALKAVAATSRRSARAG